MNDFFRGRDHHQAKEQTPLCKTDSVLKQKTEGENTQLMYFFIENTETRRNYRTLFQHKTLIAVKFEADRTYFFYYLLLV